ncbi:MAG: NADH-quinone oxidoreductase subunit A [Promethearchaeota archaeon]
MPLPLDVYTNFDMMFYFFIAFAIILIIVLLIYAIGKGLAPNNPTKQKRTTYACGESVPGVKTQFHSHLLRYAVYFTIFDIIAFMLATSMGIIGWVVVIYILIGFFAILTLRK